MIENGYCLCFNIEKGDGLLSQSTIMLSKTKKAFRPDGNLRLAIIRRSYSEHGMTLWRVYHNNGRYGQNVKGGCSKGFPCTIPGDVGLSEVGAARVTGEKITAARRRE
jgi:hypothetical protein